jgi:hypothetical protein
VEDFKTFSAKAIAGIGQLPDTVADRSIAIRLKMKSPDERIERKRERKVHALAAPLRARIESWAEANVDRLAVLDLAPMEELSDRAADIWEPLLGIAYLAGDQRGRDRWFVRAQKAAIVLSKRQPDEEEYSIRLLADAHAIFERRGGDRILTAALIEELHAIEDAPWSEWHGKPISANRLSTILRRFEIRPRQMRDGESNAKGYRREDFEDAWKRYFPAVPPSPTETTETMAPLSQESGFTNRNTDEACFVSESAANPHEQTDVSDVSTQMGGNGYLGTLYASFEAGDITEGEWQQASSAHRLVSQGLAS